MFVFLCSVEVGCDPVRRLSWRDVNQTWSLNAAQALNYRYRSSLSITPPFQFHQGAELRNDKMTGLTVRSKRDKVLIDLNNRSLGLLETGCCRFAIDTFKDALQLMKSDADPNDYDRMIVRAEQRRQSAPTTNEAPNSLLVVSAQANATEIYNLLATVRTSKVALTMNDDDETLDFPLLKAILVFNFGIAHRCCSVTANTMQSFCLQTFQYAETLTPPSCDNLLFRMILTRNLMMLSCRLGMTLCEHYKETLDPIENEIRGPLEPDDAPHEAAAA